MKTMPKNFYTCVDITILMFILLYLTGLFRPELIFLETTINGGDTGSHYPCAVHLKDLFLPQGKIMGWMQGNYAGFPLFYHYFPLPFLAMALLSGIVPMQVAFKLVSVTGIFLLPICAYAAFRAMNYRFPIPVFAAIFTVPFLFNQGNSMWGGNILSTLAGEFCFSIGFALVLLFMGTLYRGIRNHSLVVLNALLILLIALSHAYAFLFCLICGSFFLFTGFRRNLTYLVAVYGLAFLLMAFWTFPLMGNIPYTTPFVIRWTIHSVLEIFPLSIIPLCLLSVLSLVVNFRDDRSKYVLFLIVCCTAVYFCGPRMGILDIRFVPFIQILLSLFGATVIMKLTDKLKLVSILPFIVLCAATLWVNENTTLITSWINWNYSGYEKKHTWNRFNEINAYLKQSGRGRVAWEHTPLDEPLGSIRTSETLPYFAGRQTLEGIHMLGSHTAPFVFYIESETSYRPCNPLHDYFYSTLDIERGIDHFELFNVEQFVVRSPELKKALEAYPRLQLEKTVGEYDIYRLAGHDSEYVVPLKNLPVLFTTDDWRDISYQWLTLERLKETFLVFHSEGDNRDMNRFKRKASRLEDVSAIACPDEPVTVTSVIHEESIEIETSRIGHPLLIKVSYHPNWNVTGAERVFMASPSFMLIFPTQHTITLNFEPGLPAEIGTILTLMGLILVLLNPLWVKRFIRHRERNIVTDAKRFFIALAGLVLLSGIFYFSGTFLYPSASDVLKKAKQDFEAQHYSRARETYLEAIEMSQKSSGVRCEAMIFYATCFLRENRFEKAIEEFNRFIESYPRSFWTPQAFFDLAYCYSMTGNETTAQDLYRRIIRQFPTTSWAKYAHPKLKDTHGSNP